MLQALRKPWEYRREFAGAILYWSGFSHIFTAKTHPKGAIVLMYHSVAADDVASFVDPPNRLSPDLFERQMAFLHARREVVPFSRLVEQVLAGSSPKAGTVAITFDDGYLDNLTIAAPILAKYKLPATLFLATGYVQRTESQWADVLHWLMEARTKHRLHLPAADCSDANLLIRREKLYARNSLHRYLLEATYEARSDLLQEITQQLEPAASEPPRLTMNWDDVRELAHRYPFIEIGGHTRNHIDLSVHQGEMAHSEIEGCSLDIERELGQKPSLFSYPYARWCRETRQMITATSWFSAVGASRRLRVDTDFDRYAIGRIDATHSMTDLRFMTSGAYPGALVAIGIGRRA